MAYGLEYDGKWKAWVDWGDDFTVQFALYEDDVAVDLTGYEMVLGIKKNNIIVTEVTGTVSDNEVTFFISYTQLEEAGLKSGDSCTFDFWNKTLRFTWIQEGSFKLDPVSHEVN